APSPGCGGDVRRVMAAAVGCRFSLAYLAAVSGSDRLDAHPDLDVVADEGVADRGYGQLNAEPAPAELGRRRESEYVVLRDRVESPSVHSRVKDHLARRSVTAQLSHHLDPIVFLDVDPRAVKGDCGIYVGVQKHRAAQMRVAVSLTTIQCSRVDLNLNGLLRSIFGHVGNLPANIREAALDGADPQVPYREFDLR